LRRLNSTSTATVRYTTSTRVVHTVEQRFTNVESAVENGSWDDPDNLLDLAEAEAADSVASLNRLLFGGVEQCADRAPRFSTKFLYGVASE